MHDPMLPFDTNFCKCSDCGLYFRSVRAFDRHRYGKGGDRACTPDTDMPERGLYLDSKGYWRLPKAPPPDKRVARLLSDNKDK